MRARDLDKIVNEVIHSVTEDNPEYRCTVELRNPMVPKVFAVSQRAHQEFQNYPEELLMAISLGRYALDPAVETAQLFNTDEDCLCLQGEL